MSNRIGRPPNVKEAEIENWVKLYNSGMSPVEIAAADPNGRAYSTIRLRILNRVTPRKNRIGRPPNVAKEEVKQWIELYKSGMSPVEISTNDPNGRAYSTIYHYIRNQVKFRKSGRKSEATPQQVAQWKQMREQGKTYAQIAMQTNSSVQKVIRHTKRSERST